MGGRSTSLGAAAVVIFQSQGVLPGPIDDLRGFDFPVVFIDAVFRLVADASDPRAVAAISLFRVPLL